MKKRILFTEFLNEIGYDHLKDIKNYLQKELNIITYLDKSDSFYLLYVDETYYKDALIYGSNYAYQHNYYFVKWIDSSNIKVSVGYIPFIELILPKLKYKKEEFLLGEVPLDINKYLYELKVFCHLVDLEVKYLEEKNKLIIYAGCSFDKHNLIQKKAQEFNSLTSFKPYTKILYPSIFLEEKENLKLERKIK